MNTISDETIVQVDDNEPTTWAEFSRVNAFDQYDAAKVREALDAGGRFVFVGVSASVRILKVVDDRAG